MHQLQTYNLQRLFWKWSRSFWTLEKSATKRGAYFSLINVTKSVFSNKVQKCINNLIWYKKVKIQFYKYLMNELDFYTVVMLLRYAFSIIVLHIIKISRCSLCQRDSDVTFYFYNLDMTTLKSSRKPSVAGCARMRENLVQFSSKQKNQARIITFVDNQYHHYQVSLNYFFCHIIFET